MANIFIRKSVLSLNMKNVLYMHSMQDFFAVHGHREFHGNIMMAGYRFYLKILYFFQELANIYMIFV